jgi:hypothetical protein
MNKDIRFSQAYQQANNEQMIYHCTGDYELGGEGPDVYILTTSSMNKVLLFAFLVFSKASKTRQALAVVWNELREIKRLSF